MPARGLTGVSWWGTAFIRNDTAGVPRFHYNGSYAVSTWIHNTPCQTPL